MTSILKAATDIISIWEHGGLYTCHGNGAYGLIGFQGQNVTDLLKHYIELGGTLQHDTKWYASRLLSLAQQTQTRRQHRIIHELDVLAAGPLMQKAQQDMAHRYMKDSIEIQKKYFDFQYPLSQLVLCDMGVNNGKWNHYIKDAVSAHSKDEFKVISRAIQIRKQAMVKHGFWQKYAGIRNRYTWYERLVAGDKTLTMKKFCPYNNSRTI